MTRLQKEAARVFREYGCLCEYIEDSGILSIKLNESESVHIHKNNGCKFFISGPMSEKQENCYTAGIKIESIKDYIENYENAPQFDIEGIEDYRKFCEFDGFVFGAKHLGDQYGYQFASWHKEYYGTGVEYGDYSFDYEYAKQKFAERSGLIDTDYLFTTKQLENIHRCVSYTLDMLDIPSDKKNKELCNILTQIESALPYISNNSQFDFFADDE